MKTRIMANDGGLSVLLIGMLKPEHRGRECSVSKEAA
jgi:hypothetical protein